MMIQKIQRLSQKTPLTIKVVLLTFLVGLLVWTVMDRIAGNAVKAMFEDHLSEMLKVQSQEDRLRFDRYMQAFQQVAGLITKQKKFIDYTERKQWHSDEDITVQYTMKYPQWFLTSSELRALAIPAYVILLDAGGNAREVFRRRKDHLPEALLNPSDILLQKSENQAHIASIEEFPYLATSKSITNSRGVKITLFLASPVDDRLLTFAQGDFPQRLVGLVSDDNNLILTSNNPELLPAGTMIDAIQDRYVVTARSLHDYGSSEIPVIFTTFIPKKEIELMTSSLVLGSRTYRGITAFIFLLFFLLIMILITKRISRLTRRVDEFSLKALRGGKEGPIYGDKLFILEDRFQRLTEEVIESHELIRKETEDRTIRDAALKQNKNMFTLLRSIMNGLGIGVLIKGQDGFHASNRTMVSFIRDCGDLKNFELLKGNSDERAISDQDGNIRVFRLTRPQVSTGDQVILVQDISEHKKLEDQLRHSQKMESVGQLAGGIAHDFNNFLTAIIGYSNLLKMKLNKSDPLRDYAKQILASSDKAADLIRSLLAFSRKQIINPRPVDINEVVIKSEKLLSRLIRADIELKIILSNKELIATADYGQIEQVLLNLATNARDAMPDGGSLTIETGLTELDKNFTVTHGYGKPGKHVLLSITDSGEGIDASLQNKIFEPFFTTKETGKGTGLGLAMVYGIIKQHGGFINVYSEPGNGTVFKIYLQAAGSITEEEADEQLPPIKGGTETILLAEDNPDVAHLIETVLKDAGYSVIITTDGDSAVTSYMGNKDSISMLLLDVIMPGKNGKEVYAEIKKTDPEIQALFLSGYTADIMHRKGIIDTDVNFLPKPVSASDLLRKVRELLDR